VPANAPLRLPCPWVTRRPGDDDAMGGPGVDHTGATHRCSGPGIDGPSGVNDPSGPRVSCDHTTIPRSGRTDDPQPILRIVIRLLKYFAFGRLGHRFRIKDEGREWRLDPLRLADLVKGRCAIKKLSCRQCREDQRRGPSCPTSSRGQSPSKSPFKRHNDPAQQPPPHRELHIRNNECNGGLSAAADVSALPREPHTSIYARGIG
jgi:hypothetical protein